MKIAAFNVKKLGWKKVNNVFVQKYLIKIVSRYSVVVMLEVMDQSGKAMDKFLTKLNSYGRNKKHPYTMMCSESLGRSSHKEKFVYFYRKDEVTMIDAYQYKEEEDEEEEEEEEEEEDNDDDGEDEYEGEQDEYEGEQEEYEDEQEEYEGEQYEYEGEQEEYEGEQYEYEGEQYEYEGEQEEYEDEQYEYEGEQEEYEDEQYEYEGEQEEYEGEQYEYEGEQEEYDEEDDEDDNVVDMFEREPFILLLKCPNTVVQKLVLIPVHTKPADAEIELEALAVVVEAVKKRWRTDKIMILGDFNADGRYLSKKRKGKISISSAPYHWLIADEVGTTTSNCNDHTYDRIVVYKQITLDAIVPGSAKPFNFQKAFKLTDGETQSISDHYPVEVKLKTNQKAARQRKTSPP